MQIYIHCALANYLQNFPTYSNISLYCDFQYTQEVEKKPKEKLMEYKTNLNYVNDADIVYLMLRPLISCRSCVPANDTFPKYRHFLIASAASTHKLLTRIFIFFFFFFLFLISHTSTQYLSHFFFFFCYPPPPFSLQKSFCRKTLLPRKQKHSMPVF